MIERIWIWIAWHLPRRLVHWCGVRIIVYASQHPQYSSAELPAFYATEVLAIWDGSRNPLHPRALKYEDTIEGVPGQMYLKGKLDGIVETTVWATGGNYNGKG